MKKFLGYVLGALFGVLLVAGVSELLEQIPFFQTEAEDRVPISEAQLVELLDPAERYENSLCGVALLNATEKHVYCVLRDGFSRVSRGEQTETAFEMNMTGLGLTCSFGSVFGFDIGKIQTALWMDCPDVMYWNYRSKGWEYEYQYLKESEYVDSGDVTSLTVRCEVLPEYAPSTSEGYRTDPDKILAAERALQNAQALVDRCSGLSDYDKLAAYRDYICQQVEYDYAAAEMPDEDQGKGPWQIVYVFDQNPATNVVCEGYAKAFKYLCDLSEFSGDVSCYLVDGTTTGPHAWNLVQIDGRRYMADITNCDSEWGQAGYLFLAGAADATWEGFTVQCPQYDLPDGRYYEATSLRYTYSQETRQVYLHLYLTLEPTNYDPQGSQLPQISEP